MRTKSVLITGAAGFIGSHLAERCLELGWQVIGLDAFTDYYPPSLKRQNVRAALQHPNYELLEEDVLGADLGRILPEVSVVFHLAAQPGVRASWEEFDAYSRQNLHATERLLRTARGSGLERVVIASSSSIYGDAEQLPTREDVTPSPVSPYGVTKLACEHLARAYWRSYGVPAVCLRYFTVFGPRQRPDMAFHRLIRAALEKETFTIYGDGQQTRDFTFVQDAVTGTLAAGKLGVPGSSYNIGGGSRRSMNDVLVELEDLLEERVSRHHHDRQAGDARDTAANIDLAQRDLGYEPSVVFRDGLAKQLAWQRSFFGTERTRGDAPFDEARGVATRGGGGAGPCAE